MKLRPYQKKYVRDVLGRSNKGKNSLICAPTGSGKTEKFLTVVRNIISSDKKARILILTHRRELLSQTHSRLNIDSSKTLQAGDSFSSIIGAKCVVAMVQTMRNRVNKVPKEYFSHIVIDEAHRNDFIKVLEAFPNSVKIGATATPISAKKDLPMHKIYGEDGLIVHTNIKKLIKDGYLARPRHLMAVDFDDSGLKSSSMTGDYTYKSQFAMFDKKEVYSNTIDMLSQKIGSRKSIVFCVNKDHTKRTTDELIKAGYSAEYILSGMKEEERNSISDEFKRKDCGFQFLVNCEIATMGYDVPDIGAVVLNRATKSLALYMQMCGRGSRNATDDFMIFDFGGNIKRHNNWDTLRDWNHIYKHPPKKIAGGLPPMKECKNCGALIAAGAKECPFCGHVHVDKEAIAKKGKLLAIDSAKQELNGIHVHNLNYSQILKLEKTGKYSKAFIWRLLRFNGEEYLAQYAKDKGYANGWVWHQKKQSGNNSSVKDFVIRFEDLSVDTDNEVSSRIKNAIERQKNFTF